MPTVWIFSNAQSSTYNLAGTYADSSGLYVAQVDFTSGEGVIVRVNSDEGEATAYLTLSLSQSFTESQPGG